MTDVLQPTRSSRFAELLDHEYYGPIVEAVVATALQRYAGISCETDGLVVEFHQANSIPEIVKQLEESKVDEHDIDTVICDLDTGAILRPDFKRIFRIIAVYDQRTPVWVTNETM